MPRAQTRPAGAPAGGRRRAAARRPRPGNRRRPRRARRPAPPRAARSWGTTSPLRPARSVPSATASTPRLGRSSPPSDSSPKTAKRSRASAGSWPLAARTPAAMARSKPGPALRSDAGARLTVTRRAGNSKPELRIAAWTRSRASRTARSPRPTIVNVGSPARRSTSTVTRRGSMPAMAKVVTRASTVATLGRGSLRRNRASVPDLRQITHAFARRAKAAQSRRDPCAESAQTRCPLSRADP